MPGGSGPSRGRTRHKAAQSYSIQAVEPKSPTVPEGPVAAVARRAARMAPRTASVKVRHAAGLQFLPFRPPTSRKGRPGTHEGGTDPWGLSRLAVVLS